MLEGRLSERLEYLTFEWRVEELEDPLDHIVVFEKVYLFSVLSYVLFFQAAVCCLCFMAYTYIHTRFRQWIMVLSLIP